MGVRVRFEAGRDEGLRADDAPLVVPETSTHAELEAVLAAIALDALPAEGHVLLVVAQDESLVRISTTLAAAVQACGLSLEAAPVRIVYERAPVGPDDPECAPLSDWLRAVASLGDAAVCGTYDRRLARYGLTSDGALAVECAAVLHAVPTALAADESDVFVGLSNGELLSCAAYDLKVGQPLLKMTSGVCAIAVDAATIVAADASGWVHVKRRTVSNADVLWRAHAGSATFAAVLDDAHVLTAGLDGYVRVWDVGAVRSETPDSSADVFGGDEPAETRVQKPAASLHTGQAVCCAALSNQRLLACHASGVLTSVTVEFSAHGGLWTVKHSGRVPNAHAGAVSCVAGGPAGRWSTGGQDGALRLWAASGPASLRLVAELALPAEHGRLLGAAWGAGGVFAGGQAQLSFWRVRDA